MVQYLQQELDLSFAALADSTRRGIIDELGRAERSISALAERFQMTLTGMKKHVQVLERAGLVISEKVGRVRTCRLAEEGLEAQARWIEERRALFEARFAALDEVIRQIEQETSNG